METERHEQLARDRRSFALTLLGGLGFLGLTEACTTDAIGGTAETIDKAVSALNGTTNIQWVDTMPSLKGLTGAANWVAILLGYASAGDGGGGLFTWDTSASTGDDQGTIIVPTGSTTGRWKRIYAGPLDIRWFGARTGTGNDTANKAAIQAALDVGAAVYIPAGTFRFDSTLQLKPAQGGRGATLRGEGVASELCLTGSTVGLSNSLNPTAAGFTLSMFRLTTIVANATAIQLTSAWLTTIRDVHINNDGGTSWQTGIHLQNGASSPPNNAVVRISDSQVSNCAGDGIKITDDSGAGGIYIERCHVAANGGWGINIPAQPNLRLSEVHIVRNDIEGNSSGAVYADYLRTSSIVGNHLEYPVAVIPIRLGISGFCFGVQIASNYVTTQSTSCCIDLSGTLGSGGLEIVGNVFSCPSAAAAVNLGAHTNVRIANNRMAPGSQAVSLYALSSYSPQALQVQDHATNWVSGLTHRVRLATSSGPIDDSDSVILVPTSATGVVTLTLPTQSWAAGYGAVPLTVGRQFTIKSFSNYNVVVTTGGTSFGNIDGAVNWSLSYLGSVTLCYVQSISGVMLWAVI